MVEHAAPQAPTAQPEGSNTFPRLAVLEYFLKLPPPRFSRLIVEDAHEFLTAYRERLQKLRLLESRGAEFTAYQLYGTARQWCQTYRYTSPAIAPYVTWVVHRYL